MELLQSRFKKYNYYASPEGQDPINKIMGLLKITVPTGVFASYLDARFYSQCKNFPEYLNTTAYWMIPLTGMSIAFSSVAYISTNLRKKDDFLNYFFGVMASTYVLHAWQKNISNSASAAIVFLAYGYVKKYGTTDIKHNSFIPPIQDRHRGRWRYDFNEKYKFRNYEFNREDYY